LSFQLLFAGCLEHFLCLVGLCRCLASFVSLFSDVISVLV